MAYMSRAKFGITAAVLTTCLLFSIYASNYVPWDHADVARFRDAHFGGVHGHSNSSEVNEPKSKETSKVKGIKYGQKPDRKKPSSEHVEEQKPASRKRPKVNPGGNDLAFVIYLSGGDKNGDDLENMYFIAARILVWQFLHQPSTRTKNIDVVVMVDPSIGQAQRDRLAKDGAIIHVVPYLHGTVELHPVRPEWKNIMTKLRAFEMTQYSRILLLDSDCMLLRPLDGIFDDPAAQFQNTLDHEEDKAGRPPLPPKYVLAGLSEVADSNHPFPPTRKDVKNPGYMNAGFFVLAPSLEMFAHYVSYLNIADERFNTQYMEQNLLRTVHGWDGPVPWKELDYKWNIREPNENDFEKGLVSLHEKWWNPQWIYDNQKVKDWLASRRWEMKGWYDAWDQLFDD